MAAAAGPLTGAAIDQHGAPALQAERMPAIRAADDGALPRGEAAALVDAVVSFLLERLVVQQRDAAVAADVVRAAMPDPQARAIDLVDVVARVTALAAFLATDDGATLMAGYKRATNILRVEEKKDGAPVEGDVDRAGLVEPQEVALADAVERARSNVADAVAREDYAGAMQRARCAAPARRRLLRRRHGERGRPGAAHQPPAAPRGAARCHAARGGLLGHLGLASLDNRRPHHGGQLRHHDHRFGARRLRHRDPRRPARHEDRHR